MKSDKMTLIVPLLIITTGVGWLLAVQGLMPEINWVWTLALAVVGVVTFLGAGYNKFTVVVGSFFIVASCFSLLRQTGRVALDMEVPMLVITLGALLLIARHPAIPIPDWVQQPTGEPTPSGRGVRLN